MKSVVSDGTDIVGVLARQVGRTAELEQHGVAVGEHHRVATDVVHGPHLHVARAGGIADIDRVEQHDRGAVGHARRWHIAHAVALDSDLGSRSTIG